MSAEPQRRCTSFHGSVSPEDLPTGPVTTAKRIIEEFIRRQESGDENVLDDLVAVDFVNHAAGAQGAGGSAGDPAGD